MKFSNIKLGKEVEIDPSTNFNNAIIGNNVKIAKYCSVYGGPDNLIEIGDNTYIGMFSILNGFKAKLVVGRNVSIAQNVNVMVDSGPNASLAMQRVFPLICSDVSLGDNSWIGAGSIIMPGVTLGKFCIVAANSFVNKSYGDFSVIGGNPARLIRTLSIEEQNKLEEND